MRNGGCHEKIVTSMKWIIDWFPVRGRGRFTKDHDEDVRTVDATPRHFNECEPGIHLYSSSSSSITRLFFLPACGLPAAPDTASSPAIRLGVTSLSLPASPLVFP
jgi:hypothetical protein